MKNIENFGGEKGMRTVDTFNGIHAFQASEIGRASGRERG